MLAQHLLPTTTYDNFEYTHGLHAPKPLVKPLEESGDALAAQLQQVSAARQQDTARALTSLPMDLSQYKEVSGEPQIGDFVTPSSLANPLPRTAVRGQVIGILTGFKKVKGCQQIVVKWFLGNYKGRSCPVLIGDLIKVEVANGGQPASGDNPQFAALDAEKERIEKILALVRVENEELWRENSQLKGKLGSSAANSGELNAVEPPEGATWIQQGIQKVQNNLVNNLSKENASLRARLQTREQKIVEGKTKFFQEQRDKLYSENQALNEERDRLVAETESLQSQLNGLSSKLREKGDVTPGQDAGELAAVKEERDRLAAEIKGLKLELKQQANGSAIADLKNYRDCQRAIVYARIKQAQRLHQVQIDALEWAGKQELSDRKIAIETNNRFRAETLGETKSNAIAKEIALFEALRHDFGDADELTIGKIAGSFTEQGLFAFSKLDPSVRQQLVANNPENNLLTKQKVEEQSARLISRGSDFLPKEIKTAVADDMSGTSQQTAEKKLAKLAEVAAISEAAAKEVAEYLDGLDPKDSEILKETAKDVGDYGIILKNINKLSRDLGIERDIIEKAATEALHQNCVREWRALLEETAAKVKQAKKAVKCHQKSREHMDMLFAATNQDSVSQRVLLQSLEATFSGDNLRVEDGDKIVQLSLFDSSSTAGGEDLSRFLDSSYKGGKASSKKTAAAVS